MTEPPRRHAGGTGRAAVVGLAAGLAAGLVLTLATTLLRVVAGIPLPVELISDRVIPSLNIHTFGLLLKHLGGPLRGKEISYLSSFCLQIVAGVVGGLMFGIGLGRAGPERSETGRTAALRRHPIAVTAGALAVVWALMLVLLKPVLASNYRGLPPGPAAFASALGLLVSLAAYGATVLVAFRILTDGAAAKTAAEQEIPAGRPQSRRAVLVGGVSLAAAGLAGGLAGFLYRRATFGAFGYDGLQLRGARTQPVTPNDRFYVVTKNLIDPRVADGPWRLQVRGLVERARSYSLDQLAALPSVRQEQTLECISNGVGGGLISNAVWTGVPLRALLGAAGPERGVERVVIHGADGYVHTISMDKAMEPTTIVAYLMNRAPLPDRHGYPARMLVPGTYGEVSVKWVDRIELVDRAVEGYYERQGWRPYFVNTMSRFDSPTDDQVASVRSSPTVPLRGVAFAGDRGISAVEFSADDGRTWTPGALDYAPSPLAWALWSGSWTSPGPGRHVLQVRATDGQGDIQAAKRRGVVPSGATGYDRVTVVVRP